MRVSYLVFIFSLVLTSCSLTSSKTAVASTNSSSTTTKSRNPPEITKERPITHLAQKANVQSFIADMNQKYNFDTAWLTNVFNRTDLKKTIVDAMNRPAEGMNWGKYRPIFITEKRIADGVTFYKKHQATFQRAEQVYGVDAEVIAAIIGVETSYGQNKGNWAVIDALSTLAFDYPRRATYFTKELENFLVIVQETQRDPFSYKGSYAGAMGYPQFMPSSYLAYAVDFDNDGVRDLWDNPIDAIGSVGNYLGKHGWIRGGKIATKVSINNNANQHLAFKQSGRLTTPKHTAAQLRNAGVQNLTGNEKGTLYEFIVSDNPKVNEWWVGHYNFYAITRYNNSSMYALAVYQLADAIKKRI